MRKVNMTNCYLVLITILFFTTLICSRSEILNLKSECEELHKEINTIKNEAESDYQSYIQLHTCNK